LSEFLLEIGTEEIPHWMIPRALDQLGGLYKSLGTVRADATPRRLFVHVSGVPARTADLEARIPGPPISAGERAAAGFAKKQGIDISALQIVGEYYEHTKLTPGRRVIDILAEDLPGDIKAISWPKTMYWTGGKSGPRFIRPIRWLVALFDDEVIPFEIAGVKSGDVTRGHRQLGASAIPVTIANYESELRKNFVILSSEERRKKIRHGATEYKARIDEDLLETLTFITEYPTAIRGDFDPRFLALPAEVLTTVLRHHQKTFAIESETEPGMLAPHFVAIMNTIGDPDGWVKLGNERVIAARFNDAWFFWDVDQKKNLTDRVEDLRNITFHAKLGSYYDKTQRVMKLAEDFGGKDDAIEAARLCKTDLTTEMVKEFTELQGIVGGLYARAQQKPETIVRAIYEHYKPISMDDSIPSMADGRILALADKLDTLRECFRVGMMPTGSKDPFALRRAAQGVVKILVEGRFPQWFEHLSDNKELLSFLLERVRHYFTEVAGHKYDEVNAVLAAPMRQLYDAADRLRALAAVRPSEDFEPLAASFKRIRNILRQAGHQPTSYFPGTLKGPAEELYVRYSAISQQTHQDYETTLRSIASLRPAVDQFFDKVLVNDPNLEVRTNLLELLHRISTQFSTIADFSEIVTAGDQK
jgi:glycyl-tRNA synthetase beta chain